MSAEDKTWPRCARLRLTGVSLALLAALGGAFATAHEARAGESAESSAARSPTDDGATPFRGLVLDADGRPLPGATVAVRANPEEQARKIPGPKPYLTRTGKDGSFDSGEMLGTRLDLRVRAKRLAFRTYRRLTPDGPLTVRLETGHPLSGRVLARTTGEGIPGVRVELDDSELFEFGTAGLETVTDSEGNYRFLHAPSGKIWVRATEPGWARRSIRGEIRPAISGDEPTRLEELWLPPGGELSGRIVDTKGEPVVGALVFVASVDLERGAHHRSFPTSWMQTDESGRYRFEGVTAGARYQVRASHDSFSPGVSAPIWIGARTVLEGVDLTLGQGAALRLRLVDADGRPCTQATLRFVSEEDARTDLAFEQWFRSTKNGDLEVGDEGWLTTRKLNPGRFSIRIEPDGWAGLQRENVLLTECETTDLGSIPLQPGAVIQGRVIEEAGDPVAGAAVALHWRDMQQSYERDAVADADGRFSLGGLPDHSLTMTVSAEQYAERNLERVRPGADDVIVTLLRRGGIRGRVKLAEGGRPSTFRVRAHDEDGISAPSPKIEIEIEIETGSFQIHELDPGAYGLEIRASGRAAGRVEKAEVRSGEITDVGQVVLRSGLRLEGRVVSADGGAAVVGASIRIDRGSGPSRWSRESGQLIAVSDAHGNFSFDELDAGRSTLSLLHTDFAPILQSLDLRADTPKTSIVLELTGGGEIRGLLVDSDGLPLVGADVTVYRGMRGFDLRQTITAEDGSFQFPRLAAGTYIVMRSSSEASPFDRQVRTVDVREGQVTEVKFAKSER